MPSRWDIQVIDPLQDPRWQRFVDSLPNSSIFHSVGWLQCLKRTYDYRPLVLAIATTGREIHAGIVFCAIRTWLTGARLVSLPFSDHCEPLVHQQEELSGLIQETSKISDMHRYVELRPLNPDLATAIQRAGFTPSASFIIHRLDLRPGAAALYKRFHKDCVQRKIRRAESEGIRVEVGRSEKLLKDFYRLHLLTRRKHGQVSQPFAWFRNMAECLSASMQVRVAYKGSQAVASIVTLTHSDRVVYKYGASDAAQNALGGTQLLFWNVIEESCRQGLRELDMGRTDLDNPGLATFKERWGATRSDLVYWRNPAGTANLPNYTLARKILAKAPTALLRAAGALLYRHAG